MFLLNTSYTNMFNTCPNLYTIFQETIHCRKRGIRVEGCQRQGSVGKIGTNKSSLPSPLLPSELMQQIYWALTIYNKMKGKRWVSPTLHFQGPHQEVEKAEYKSSSFSLQFLLPTTSQQGVREQFRDLHYMGLHQVAILWNDEYIWPLLYLRRLCLLKNKYAEEYKTSTYLGEIFFISLSTFNTKQHCAPKELLLLTGDIYRALLFARHKTTCITCLLSFILQIILWGLCYCFPPFRNGKTEVCRLRKWEKLVSAKAQFKTLPHHSNAGAFNPLSTRRQNTGKHGV